MKREENPRPNVGEAEIRSSEKSFGQDLDRKPLNGVKKKKKRQEQTGSFDFAKLDLSALRRYKKIFDVRVPHIISKADLAAEVQNHFTEYQIKDENLLINNFLDALHGRPVRRDVVVKSEPKREDTSQESSVPAGTDSTATDVQPK
eukprot:TRINITY_DN14430_c0_g1_i1.p1 TRINITY_DN14430_c0_g1~~TRINITY_DN14430_c0_g1_i1.p1  ORF type:complete len:146 (+),score=9.41 TRINITY_DN14430_c0_g1_i1:172-609(+)